MRKVLNHTKRVRVRFIRDWRDVRAGEICEVDTGLARLLLKRGIVVRLTDYTVTEKH